MFYLMENVPSFLDEKYISLQILNWEYFLHCLDLVALIVDLIENNCYFDFTKRDTIIELAHDFKNDTEQILYRVDVIQSWHDTEQTYYKAEMIQIGHDTDRTWYKSDIIQSTHNTEQT